MKTSEVIKKHQKQFKHIRIMMQILLVLVTAIIVYVQFPNIIRFLKWTGGSI